MNLGDIRTRPRLRATTIIAVKRDAAVAMAGDGQVTYGDVVLKHGARKLRTLYNGQILAGFAGAVADGLTLFGKFEMQLKAWDGNLRRASVELAKEWRTDRYLRRLEAQLIVADLDSLLVLSGEGDVIEPDDGIVAIGSGAPYATAAAKALIANTDLDARAIVAEAMRVAAELCIFTNDHFTIETVVAESAERQPDDEESPLLIVETGREPRTIEDDDEAEEDDDDDRVERDEDAASDEVDDDLEGGRR